MSTAFVSSHPCILGTPISPAELARRVTDAFERLGGPLMPPPKWAADWGGDPISQDALVAEFGAATNEDDTVDGANGFRIGYVKDADRPRRPKHNLDLERRSRSKLREACRFDAAEFRKLVSDDVVRRLTLNPDERACEVLDLVLQREDDPGLEVFRRGVIACGKLGEPFPFAAIYFDRKAERLAAEGYREAPPRTPRRLPGAVTGAHAACAEHGLTLDELEQAISEGSKPIVRRGGVVIALRKREAPNRFRHPKPEPSTRKSQPALRLVVDHDISDRAAAPAGRSDIEQALRAA